MMGIDIATNRNTKKYDSRELLWRIAWGVGSIAFRLSPRWLYGFRRWLLRRFGAKVGGHVHIYPTVKIQYPWLLEIGDYSAIGDGARIYNLGPLKIGARATISQMAHLCGGSHDYQSPDMALIRSPITIEEDAWVCADAFIGPGVTVGRGAVVGARTVVAKDVRAWSIVVGNPAREIGERTLHGGIAPGAPMGGNDL